jgi:Protein of unknown function (DUF3455)
MIRAIGLTFLIAGLTLAAFAATEPNVPKDVAVPDRLTLVASVTAKGVQVYKAVEGKSGALEWTLEGPLADLSDEKGDRVGWHYDGPAWEATDGSKVVRDEAEAVKQAPATDPKAAIPWLLVKVKVADDKPGEFAGVVYIQRLNTAGGSAPADPPKRIGTRVGVPYTAVYQLWAKK